MRSHRVLPAAHDVAVTLGLEGRPVPAVARLVHLGPEVFYPTLCDHVRPSLPVDRRSAIS